MAARKPQPKWLVVGVTTTYYEDNTMTIISAPSFEKAAEKVCKANGYTTSKQTYQVYQLGELTKVEITPVLDIKVKK